MRGLPIRNQSGRSPSLSTIQMTVLKSGWRRSPAGRARAECERISAREKQLMLGRRKRLVARDQP